MIIDAGAESCTYVGRYRRTYVHDLADRLRASLEQYRERQSLTQSLTVSLPERCPRRAVVDAGAIHLTEERWPRRAVVDAGAIPLTERTTIPEELEVVHPLFRRLFRLGLGGGAVATAATSALPSWTLLVGQRPALPPEQNSLGAAVATVATGPSAAPVATAPAADAPVAPVLPAAAPAASAPATAAVISPPPLPPLPPLPPAPATARVTNHES